MKSLVISLIFIYFVWLLIFGPLFYSGKVHSIFNTMDAHDNRAIEMMANTQRKQKIKLKLDLLNHSMKIYHQNKLGNHSNDHVVIIIATKEASTSGKYSLSQLVMQMDQAMREDPKSAMIICDQTEVHSEEMRVLLQLFPVHKPTSVSKSSSKRRNQQETKKNNFVQCIRSVERVIEYHPKYLTVLYDTIVPYDNFIRNLRQALDYKIESKILRGERVKLTQYPWMYLLLQEPHDLRGFSMDGSSFVELLVVSCTGAFVFYLYAVYCETRFYSSRTALNVTVIFCIFGAIFFLTCALVMGRPYLTEFRRHFPSLQRIYELTNPVEISAVIMNSTNAMEIVKELDKSMCSNYFTFAHTWHHLTNAFDIPGYILSPSLVRYV